MSMVLTAVFLLSFSALAFEVLLARVFSISQWNHLAFMVISIALFGFAASGTFLSILDVRRQGWERRLCQAGPLAGIVLLSTAGTLLAFVVLIRLPLDYFRLPLEPVQTVYLLIAYLVLALPFFFSGLAISLAYAAIPEKTGRIYLATMAGSALGAFFPAPLLPLLGESHLVIATAVTPLIWVIFWGKTTPEEGSFKRSLGRFWPRVAAAAIMVAALILSASDAVSVAPSAYKDLSQLLMLPDTRIVDSKTGIRGRIDTVDSPYIRFAPGQSLTFSAALPSQRAQFIDGGDRLVLFGQRDPRDSSFCRQSLPYTGYLLSARVDPVLVIAHGGGSAIPCALAAGAEDITVLSSNPSRAESIAAHYDLLSIARNPRVFLARNKKKYAVIQVDAWGPTIPGTAALTQGYLLTVEAFSTYLDHLLPHGRLILSRRLLLPPAETIRLWAAAYEALKNRGVSSPGRHLLLVRNYDSFTLVASGQPLKISSRLKTFVQEKNFDFIHAPGVGREDINRFNRFDRPYHFEAITGLAQAYKNGNPERFYHAYPLDVAPQKDSRPYPHRFLKWSGAKEIYRSTGRRLYSLLMSGEVVVAVLFVEALAVAFLLLVLPLWAVRHRGTRPPAAQVFFFVGVGAGFMFVELFFIKAFTLIFDNPVISFTVVLTGLLVSSGIGGFWSERLNRGWIRQTLGLLLLLLSALFFGLDGIIHLTLGWNDGLRFTTAVLVLAPVGFLMGISFSLGMRYLPQGPAQRAVAWTANGCASVLSAIGAAQIAVALGIPVVLGFGIAGYLIASLAAGLK